MTTLLEMITEVYTATGRSDSEMLVAAKRGINTGLYAATLMFEPVEMNSTSSHVVGAGVDYMNLSVLTRMLRIHTVKDSTNGQMLYILPPRTGDYVWVPTGNYPLFYSIEGHRLYLTPTPVAQVTLAVYYLRYAARLVNETDVIPIPTHFDDFILSFALEVVHAFFEESDSNAMWQKVTDRMGIPEQLTKGIKDFALREFKNVNNV